MVILGLVVGDGIGLTGIDELVGRVEPRPDKGRRVRPRRDSVSKRPRRVNLLLAFVGHVDDDPGRIDWNQGAVRFFAAT